MTGDPRDPVNCTHPAHDAEGKCLRCNELHPAEREAPPGNTEPRLSILVSALDRLGIKADSYGLPENSFPLIAALWREYLGISRDTALTPDDVPAMLILMKLARKRNGAGKRDNWRDIAGYAHCGDVLENPKDQA